jgi:sensor histidine kinase YesM
MADAPRVDWRFAALCALILDILFTIQFWVSQQNLPLGIAFARQTVTWAVWLGLAPFVIASARKHPFVDSASRGRWLARQIVIGGGYSIVHSVIAASLRIGLGVAYADNIIEAIITSLLLGLGANYLRYALIAVSYQAIVYHRTIRERDAQAARLRVDLAEAKLATLEGRLRPHFLFNTLNAIAALIRENPAAAEEMIGQLSDLLRASLKADPLREVSLADELKLVDQYLAIQQARFQERLRVTVCASDAARRAYVPYLILQPLVENAVRHGIAPRESGGHVWIDANQNNEHLVITIEDDGVGIGNAPPELAGTGLGLGGVKSRLEHLYAADHRLDVEARRPSGTRVRIEIPYRAAHVAAEAITV